MRQLFTINTQKVTGSVKEEGIMMRDQVSLHNANHTVPESRKEICGICGQVILDNDNSKLKVPHMCIKCSRKLHLWIFKEMKADRLKKLQGSKER